MPLFICRRGPVRRSIHILVDPLVQKEVIVIIENRCRRQALRYRARPELGHQLAASSHIYEFDNGTVDGAIWMPRALEWVHPIYRVRLTQQRREPLNVGQMPGLLAAEQHLLIRFVNLEYCP